jgi:flavodoxin
VIVLYQKATIIYEARTGNTQIMAKAIQEVVKEAGIAVLLKRTKR